jgi:hypothetical protein
VRKSLEQVRWMLKARELPDQFCPVLLELVLDMVSDVAPGVLRECRVTLEEGTGPLPARLVKR